MLNKLLITIAIILISVFSSNAQEDTNWKYVSPLPGSSNINPENNISFRNGQPLDQKSVIADIIEVYGSKSGEITGNLFLSSDDRTLIFQPDIPFIESESISVLLRKGIETKNGEVLNECATNFSVRSKSLSDPLENEDEFNLHIRTGKTPVETVFSYNNLITYGDASLPGNLVIPEIITYNNPANEYVFLGVEPKTDRYDFYALIIDKYGTPVFYREWPSKTVNFQVSANNKLIHKNSLTDGFDKNSFLVLNDKYEIIDTLQVGNGYKTNTHDGILLENGNHFLMIYDSQLVGMDTVVTGGNPDATVKGFIFQELDADHNVIFQWRSWDHFEITDANHVNLLGAQIDYVHVNGFDTTADGNFLLCCRHFDEITKVDLNSGDIIWRFGKNAKNNMFEISDDPLGFSYPHDVQEIENGNITMYDNGNNHDSAVSSGVEYKLDEVNMTASLEWKYTRDPAFYGPTKGSTRRLGNGNTLIGWGTHYPIVATEVNKDNEIEWELSLDSCISYRAMSSSWETSAFLTNVDTIDFGYYDGYEPWPVIFLVTNNTDDAINITSASHHSPAFTLETILPVTIPAGGTGNLMLSFFPESMGEQDFNDVLTINADGFYSDTLHQRISRQIRLLGTTIDHSSIRENYNINFSVYPNPVEDGKFIIESFNEEIESYSLYDLSGRVVFKGADIQSNKTTVVLNNLVTGVYMLNIRFTDGSKGLPMKLVVN